MNDLEIRDQVLVKDIRTLIEEAKERIAVTVNSQMTLLYWQIGKRIQEEVIKSNRAEYGKQVIKSLARYLSTEYGSGFGRSNLLNMIQFYELFSDYQIVQTLSGQLSWSHVVALCTLKLQEQREFYTYMAIESGWSVRQLRHNMNIMMYERTLSSQKSNKPLTIPPISKEQADELMQPEILLKDPYILQFLQLPDNYQEKDLENAILKEIEKFLLELGTGFSFVARQKRITIDGDHFYIDLLLYNRKLKRLIVLELKRSKFKPEYKGQMEFYLNYLKKHETFPGEEPPIGIILCTEKSYSQIEFMDLLNSGIHVAQYLTELPPKDVFERKIRQIVTHVQENIAKLSYIDETAISDDNKSDE